VTSEEKWSRRLARERAARKHAEELLESKSLELWAANQELASVNQDLESRIRLRTLVEECCDLLAEKCRAKGLELIGILGNDPDTARVGDPGRSDRYS